MLKRFSCPALLLILIAIFLPAFSHAEEWKKPKGVAALKIGILGKGKIHYNHNGVMDISKSSFSGGFVLVFPVYRRFYIGPSFDLYMAKEARSQGRDEPILDFAFNLKSKFKTGNRNIFLWPTFSIGYAFPKDKEEFEDVYGITLKLFCDFVYQASDKVGLLAEIGGAYSPYVHHPDYDNVTAGPLLTLRGGFLF